MSEIRLDKIKIRNYRSFGSEQIFDFPNSDYGKPVSIIGYNNAGKTNLMNAILYGIGEKFINSNTFEKTDLHKLSLENQIEIKTRITASSYQVWSDYHGREVDKSIGGDHAVTTSMSDKEIHAKVEPSFFGANKHYKIFYINFHKIKDEISTKKSSWGNLSSFLGKHIKRIVESDVTMNTKKEDFKANTKAATDAVLNDSNLSKFISSIKNNYSKNLRNNNCEVEFGLPDYEEIFLQMIFKIGLNGDSTNLIPIDHFGDGYISMFVMAVIQSIAEENSDDKCLFLFEEPESFLHENHQEYFYKMVLCQLAKKGHQVIYTTHSDRMIDVFDTKSIIRIEFDETEKKTIKKYNNIADFTTRNADIISVQNYNSFIKSIEPNLNKILFSRKVILLEGPNDLLAYNYAIEKKVNAIVNDEQYSKSYLNFYNISLLVHHGKATALLLIEICKHFGLNYFVINDWDFEENLVQEVSEFANEIEFRVSQLYLTEKATDRSSTRKAMLMTNWRLIQTAGLQNIHFNIPKLESVLDYTSNDKSSLGIWNRLNQIDDFGQNFISEKLIEFLELNQINREIIEEISSDEDLPF